MDKGDSLGNRMKMSYEYRTRFMLIRRVPVIIRVDGKAFSSLTKGLEKPFDSGFIKTMQETAKYLCEEVQGCKLAYVQSDEISLLLTDWEKEDTQAWFDYNLQKVCSVSASFATRAFNDIKPKEMRQGCFDSRAFNIPKEEVVNYFIWRQQDATRNSIQSLAQANFPHKQLHGLNSSQLQEKLMAEKLVNWDALYTHLKRGSCIVKKYEQAYASSYTGGPKSVYNSITGEWEDSPLQLMEVSAVVRPKWTVDNEIPIFTQNREYIERLLK